MATPIEGTWYYYKVSLGGGFSTGIIPAIIGKTINEIFRDGFKYRKVTGLPTGKEFNLDSMRGELLFDTKGAPLNADEIIAVKIEQGSIQQGSES